MTMLLFYVGQNAYAIDCSKISRIIPFVALKPIHYTSVYIAGLLNLEGKAIPVIDFCQLTEQRAATHQLSTRIILVKYLETNSKERQVGILAEKVHDLLNISSAELVEPNFALGPFPFLNRVISKNHEIIQYLDIEKFFHFLETDLFKLIENENHG